MPSAKNSEPGLRLRELPQDPRSRARSNNQELDLGKGAKITYKITDHYPTFAVSVRFNCAFCRSAVLFGTLGLDLRAGGI